MEWPAEEYAIGSYIQATIADTVLPKIHLRPTDKVLDVGCGNGSYTKKILVQVPQGSVLGVDASENMVRLAKEVTKDYPNFSAQRANALELNFTDQFDKVLSFWCLQWVPEIEKAFANIINALKPGGSFFTLFPAGDDPFIMSYFAIKESRLFPELEHFIAPVDYSRFNNLAQKLETLRCNNLQVIKHQSCIILPDLSIFRKFVNGIAFYQGQVLEDKIKQINEAMVTWYDQECKRKWQGEYRFYCSLYLVTGENKS